MWGRQDNRLNRFCLCGAQRDFATQYEDKRMDSRKCKCLLVVRTKAFLGVVSTLKEMKYCSGIVIGLYFDKINNEE